MGKVSDFFYASNTSYLNLTFDNHTLSKSWGTTLSISWIDSWSCGCVALLRWSKSIGSCLENTNSRTKWGFLDIGSIGRHHGANFKIHPISYRRWFSRQNPKWVISKLILFSAYKLSLEKPRQCGRWVCRLLLKILIKIFWGQKKFRFSDTNSSIDSLEI